MSRYSITGVQKMIGELDEWIVGSQSTLDNAESADYPNDERIEALTERIEALEAAKEALEEIE